MIAGYCTRCDLVITGDAVAAGKAFPCVAGSRRHQGKCKGVAFVGANADAVFTKVNAALHAGAVASLGAA